MLVDYQLEGRFGNNLFQYAHAKLVSVLTSNILQNQHQRPAGDCITLYESNVNQVFTNPAQFVGKNIYLQGYFQHAQLLFDNKDYLWSKNFQSTEDKVNKSYKVSEIFQQIEVPEDVVVVHLRLDDFIHDQYNANIVDPKFYVEQILQSNKNQVWIVCDVHKNTNEQKYVDYIAKHCPQCVFTFKSADLLTDWNTVRCASYVISSNSTFAWLACFFNDRAKVIVYPETHMYAHQRLVVNNQVWKTIEKVKRVNYNLYNYNE
jgi:hypothetical protein